MELIRIVGGEWLRTLRALPGRDRLYLNVGHTALQDHGYLAWTRSAGVRPVYMVHDLIPITHPEYCRSGEAQRHAQRVRNMLASAVGIIGNSQATLNSLQSFAESASLTVPPQTAAPLGIEMHDGDAAMPKRPDRPTFVMLGTIEGRESPTFAPNLGAACAGPRNGCAAPSRNRTARLGVRRGVRTNGPKRSLAWHCQRDQPLQ